MGCYVCSGKGELFHLGRSICRKCFLRNMEKRVKKCLGRKLFKKGDRVLVVGSLEKVLLEKAVQGLPLKITAKEKMPASARGFKQIVYGQTMDEVEEKFLGDLFKGKLKIGRERKFFNILEPLTEEEVRKYAELRGVEFKGESERERRKERGRKEKEGGKKKREEKGRGKKENKEKGREFLEGLKEFKELRYNLLKNMREIRKIKET